jgi:hypothetical protein
MIRRFSAQEFGALPESAQAAAWRELRHFIERRERTVRQEVVAP